MIILSLENHDFPHFLLKTNPGFEQKMRKIMIFETKYDHRGVSRNYRMDKNSPEMNDSEVELIAKKKPDEKYYFFVEKS